MSRKNQKKRRGEPKVDEHHILYTHHEWNKIGRWGKLLRNHPYYKKIIPVKNLHNAIHRQVPFITPPSNEICKFIYESTEHALMNYVIDIEYDTIEQRIDFFLSCLDLYRGEKDYTATVVSLQKQRKIVADYYAKHSTTSTSNKYHKIPIYRDRVEKFCILFPDKTWGVKGHSKVLSKNSYFTVRISENLINEIRSNICEIKKPSNSCSLKNINQKLEHARKTKDINPREDSLESRIYFLINAFLEEGEKETAADLEEMLNIIEFFYKKRC